MEWIGCRLCNIQLQSIKQYKRHVLDTHNTEFGICRRKFDKPRIRRRHENNEHFSDSGPPGIESSTPTSEPGLMMPCPTCGISFKGDRGLSTHRRRAHPVERNAEVLAKVRETKGSTRGRGFRWTPEEHDELKMPFSGSKEKVPIFLSRYFGRVRQFPSTGKD